MDLERRLEGLNGATVDRRSVVEVDGGSVFFLRREDGTRLLGVVGELTAFAGERHGAGGLLLCPPSADNLAALRELLPWLRPAPLGLRTSAGFGDRLGVATPGHVRAIRRVPDGPDRIAPVFAQQSVRENARTGRTPQQVLDDAAWGVFAAGWRRPWGADADHLKTPADADVYIDAGYTMFTIDPGEHVDDALEATPAELEAKVTALPWEILEDSRSDLERRYLSRSLEIDGHLAAFDRGLLWRAAVKYGGAVAHTVAMARHISERLAGRDFELEISVDETESPTTTLEHLYIATELRRLGVRWVSLAPRFVGRFEKGVDYLGDVQIFAAEFARHAAVARQCGPYKLSLHSGSDKFSIYPVTAELSAPGRGRSPGPLLHLKTAGTSFLEALRAIARTNPLLFRELLDLARDAYPADRATYHVSADIAKVPASADLADDELAGLLDLFDARQVLHVTFGSLLDRYRDSILAELAGNEEVYSSGLEAHMARHLTPFVGPGREAP